VKWVTTRGDQLSAGDVILWGTARTIESVAGNADRIVVTFEGGDAVPFGHASPVWRREA